MSSTEHTGLCCVIGAALGGLPVTESVCVPAQLNGKHDARHAAILQETSLIPGRSWPDRAGKTVEEITEKIRRFRPGTSRNGLLHPKRQGQNHVLSEHGKEAVVGIFGEGRSSRACLRGGELRSAPAMPWKSA